MFWRKTKKADSACPAVPVTKEVMTDIGKITALDFGADAQQCCAYLKAALPTAKHKGNSVMACFVTNEAKPTLWTFLAKERISGRVWSKDARIGKKNVTLFLPLGMKF